MTMATLRVHPRQTPAERPEHDVTVQIDEAFSVLLSIVEDWVAPRQNWELELREGHEFGRPNNVEVELLYVNGEQTSTLSFRLLQLEFAEDLAEELLLRFEERDGIAKVAHLRAQGLDVELFHILAFT
jgi:hypothetical protein